ncbi:MAG: leucine--tRNA ligase [Dehalococcoidia bacterium]|jgi:leucyl-tRNA synthetase|nr:MAG: leucine--tRNA ligase [Dehalococcoidia bacterium]
MTASYDPKVYDTKWQQRWAADHLYEADETSDRPRWYALTMFPYTSGDLHIGHWYAMVPSDVHARFKRMQGYNVMHPMGFDAFGLPAENAAIKRGIHPFQWTMKNIENMRRQLKSMGAIYDWDREVVTCLPEYYRWTQWFFLKLYEAGLAYRAKAPVNWCPGCRTVLANEQVISGECERCATPVIHQDLEQWFFRITRYADELARHDGIDWPERIKIMQRNWVGKSRGTEISFAFDHPAVKDKELRVFTTRPDTVYGVTFMVLAPEHPLVEKITTPEQKAAVEAYIARSRRETEIERLSTEKEKDGVFTGAYVTNRLTGDKVPLWIADYVLASYGTGVVMAVPAHDQRDFDFARKYNLLVKVVISPPGWSGEELKEAYVETGTLVNSGQFNGMASDKAIGAITGYLEKQGWGKATVSYRIRDWLISRQRYWGAPIPIIYCDKCGIVPVPEKDLPVLLPEDAEFKPGGESPLKYASHFVNTTCPKCGGPAKRETDTMDTFMCSSWYFLRYCSPHEKDRAFDHEKVKYWMPVDLYTGGAEHAVMHLLYARFFVKAIRDIGLVDFGEPFKKLFNQGIIIAQRQKMSKSRGNVINPDSYVAELGVDAVRTYLMFLGPWEQGGEWDDRGMGGTDRWLKRVWNLVMEPYQTDRPADEKALKDLKRLTHQTIRKVTEDFDGMHFNTMIAALMEFTNDLIKIKEAGSVSVADWEEAIQTLLLLLAPTAPHLTEELWERTGRPYSIHNQKWPVWDAELAKEEEITLVVQVNGKLRDRITLPAGISEEEIKLRALASDKVKTHLVGKELVKVIVAGGRLVNLVVK